MRGGLSPFNTALSTKIKVSYEILKVRDGFPMDLNPKFVGAACRLAIRRWPPIHSFPPRADTISLLTIALHFVLSRRDGEFE